MRGAFFVGIIASQYFFGMVGIMFIRKKGPCKACRTIRLFILSVIPLIFLIGTNQGINLPDWDFHNLIGDFFLVLFLIVLGWRVYKDFWKTDKNN